MAPVVEEVLVVCLSVRLFVGNVRVSGPATRWRTILDVQFLHQANA